MPLPVTLTIAYLVVNLGFTVWIERARMAGGVPPRGLTTLSATLRYGPPIVGLIYLETLAGDWLFVGFVAFFFGLAFWMLDKLLNYPSEPPERRRRP